jgi:hypothetical protein
MKKPKMYRKTKSTKPVKPLYERFIDWTKIAIRPPFMDGRRGM